MITEVKNLNRMEPVKFDLDYDEVVDESDDYIDEPLPEEYTASRQGALWMYIHTILVRESSPSHKLTHKDLIERLDRYPFAMSVERRTVGRALKGLEREHIGIHTSGNGAWYELGSNAA